jgi:hypothetical protein
MRLTVFAATLAFLLWGTPAFAGSAPDFDNDGVADGVDNCSEKANTAQDDTDVDDCGNLCDADYNNDGVVGFPDYGAFATAFGKTDSPEQCHTEPITNPACTVGFPDYGYFATSFAGGAGPSGTTAGTTACPNPSP